MSEPQITIQAAHYSSGGNSPVNRIVIHATSPTMSGHSASQPGMARSTAQYFTSSSSGGSAHYIVDAGGDEQHCVRDKDRAWHAPPNGNSIGIEICSESTYGRADWISRDVFPAVELAARRTRELCDRFGVPLEKLTAGDLASGRRGICSHADVSQAWHESDHWDPGTSFPWDQFMELVGGSGSSTGGDWYDEMKDTDVIGEVRVSDRALYQLEKGGGVRVVGGDGRGIDAEPFHTYTITGNDGSRYTFGPDRNDGVFSYPGLPAGARQGNRFFTNITVGG